MEYTKQPITLAEQINILKQRGLIFENEDEALSVLNHISYFRFRKYDSPEFPPSWKTLEVASFGTLSKLYNNMNDFNLMKRVARDFDMPQHEYLRSWLESLTIVRNYCAHHARLWNAHFAVRPKITSRMRQRWITNFNFPIDRLYRCKTCGYEAEVYDGRGLWLSPKKSFGLSELNV
ncbi:MAG: Abi family protein [Prevotella sp.]|nr:Abi family protein [Prevotella sp.]